MTKIVVNRDRSGERWLREEHMRQTEVGYITDRLRRPTEYWWEQLCSEVPLPELNFRARKGRWVERREEYWESVTQEVLRKSKYAAIRDRVAELQEIQQLRANALELIQPEIINGKKTYRVAPSSLEGMIRATIDLDKLADSKRDAVLTLIEPEIQRELEKPASQLFTTDELRDVATNLLKQRRERQRQLALQPAKGVPDEGQDP